MAQGQKNRPPSENRTLYNSLLIELTNHYTTWSLRGYLSSTECIRHIFKHDGTSSKIVRFILSNHLGICIRNEKAMTILIFFIHSVDSILNKTVLNRTLNGCYCWVLLTIVTWVSQHMLVFSLFWVFFFFFFTNLTNDMATFICTCAESLIKIL